MRDQNQTLIIDKGREKDFFLNYTPPCLVKEVVLERFELNIRNINHKVNVEFGNVKTTLLDLSFKILS
jgi:hypothetical protein